MSLPPSSLVEIDAGVASIQTTNKTKRYINFNLKLFVRERGKDPPPRKSTATAMKRTLRFPTQSAVCLSAAVLTAMASDYLVQAVRVSADTPSLRAGSIGDSSSPSSSTTTAYDFHAAASGVGRRLEDTGFQGETEELKITDYFLLAGLVIFIVALAFPAITLTYCAVIGRVCCGVGLSPRDTPPSEVEVMEGPCGDYKLVEQVSSTTLASDSNHTHPIS